MDISSRALKSYGEREFERTITLFLFLSNSGSKVGNKFQNIQTLSLSRPRFLSLLCYLSKFSFLKSKYLQLWNL